VYYIKPFLLERLGNATGKEHVGINEQDAGGGGGRRAHAALQEKPKGISPRRHGDTEAARRKALLGKAKAKTLNTEEQRKQRTKRGKRKAVERAKTKSTPNRRKSRRPRTNKKFATDFRRFTQIKPFGRELTLMNANL
jgi:hypothetical protein